MHVPMLHVVHVTMHACIAGRMMEVIQHSAIIKVMSSIPCNHQHEVCGAQGAVSFLR